MPEEDEEEAKKRMDALLLVRVYFMHAWLSISPIIALDQMV